MAKERTINPAQAQRKLEKQKALKKGKAELAARRTEKLARRNPARLQRQIDELRSAEASGHTLNAREKKQLEELERDVKAVQKAREALGDKAPPLGGGGGPGPGLGGRERGRGRDGRSGGERGGREARGEGTLGKRRREGGFDGGEAGRRGEESDSSTPESVKNIPMPRDTPPPTPPGFLPLQQQRRRTSANPNFEPLAPNARRLPHPLPARPDSIPAPTPTPVQAQTVYEGKPVVRDLRREAVSAFVPSAVRQKMGALKGQGKLLEPEEVEALEREGYRTTVKGDVGGEVDGAILERGKSLEEEERRFEQEVKAVAIEEVEDEDG